jgi:hypothetical protein
LVLNILFCEGPLLHILSHIIGRKCAFARDKDHVLASNGFSPILG